MATNTVSLSHPEDRLECLKDICGRLAQGLANALDTLRNNAEDPAVVHLVADALERLGWMADCATVVAGDSRPMVRGDAAGWMMGHVYDDLQRKLAKEVAHG